MCILQWRKLPLIAAPPATLWCLSASSQDLRLTTKYLDKQVCVGRALSAPL